MLSKSLSIFVGIGIISGLLFGIYLIDVKNTSQLVYVEGSGISVITEKTDFKQGEEIKIRIVNSGTVPLTYDASFGLRVTGLSGILMYSPSFSTEKVVSTLEPNEEVNISWDQINNDGDPALEGLYKITAVATDNQGKKVERSTTVTIWK